MSSTKYDFPVEKTEHSKKTLFSPKLVSLSQTGSVEHDESGFRIASFDSYGIRSIEINLICIDIFIITWSVWSISDMGL